MYGLQAINAANGWIISLAGILIVLSGLAVLSLLISSIPKLLGIWDRQKEIFSARRRPLAVEQDRTLKELAGKKLPELSAEIAVIQLTRDQKEAASSFEMLANRMGECFSLPLLLQQAEKRGIYKPHSNLATFLRLGLIEECGGELTGFYRWQKKARVVVSESKRKRSR